MARTARQNSMLSSRIRERRRKRQFRLAVLFFVLVVVLAGALIYFSRLASLSISDVEVTGTKMADAGGIQTLVKNDISGNYLAAFPRKNIFLYPARGIERDILSQFPVVKTVSLSRNPSTVLQVAVDERSPFALWCGTVLDPAAPDDSCLFIDDGGVTFGQAPSFSANTFFEWYGPLATTSPSFTFRGATDFSSLNANLQSFEHAGYAPIRGVVSDGDIRFIMANGAEVLVTEKDFPYDLDKLKSFMTGSVLPSSAKATLDGVDYLDLRFDNKVYSKMKDTGGGLPGNATSSSSLMIPL